LVAKGISNRIREIVIKFGSARTKPGKRSRLVEFDFKHTAAGSCQVDGAPGMVFAEARWSACSKNFFNSRSGFDLSANDLGLAVDATESRNNEQRDSIIVGCCLENAPSFGSGDNKQMISSVCSNFCNFKAAGFFTNTQATSRYQFT